MSSIWFTIIVQPLYNLLIIFYNYLGSDMGIAIIAFTVLIRLIFRPSQAKALKSQKELSELQPEIDAIRKKYKDNPQKQSQEMLSLYRTKKISPFSSCLPLLIQFPILIAIYSIFQKNLNKESLSWLYGFISRPDNINVNFFGLVDLSQPEKIFFPIIAGITQFILAWLTQKNIKTQKKDNSNKKDQMFDIQSMLSKQMIYFFPIMIVIISMSLPSALVLYWVITNIFMIVQQYIVNKGIAFRAPKVALKVKKK